MLVILGRDGYFTGALVYSNVDDNIHFDILHWNNLLILQLSPIFTLANVGLIVYLKLFVTLGILVTYPLIGSDGIAGLQVIQNFFCFVINEFPRIEGIGLFDVAL